MTRTIAIIAMTCLLALAAPAMGKQTAEPITISVLEAAQMLASQPKEVFLVDVRTRQEYALLGHPPQGYNVPWRLATNDFQIKGGPYQGNKAAYTGYQLSSKPNPDFIGVIKSLFKPGDKLLILSTAGEQGAEAAAALSKAGFTQVFNLEHGFLGQPLLVDKQAELAEKYSPLYGSRGRLNGWLFWGLPVTHHMDPRYIYPPDTKRMQTQK
ncbi:MAG: rhodanese-like domain-containing protein [Pseudomonadota bacterium]